MKRILCIITVVCIFVSAFCFETSSLEFYNCNNLKGCENISLIEDNNQIYLCGYKGCDFFVNRLYPINDNITLTCELKIDEYTLTDGTLSILCKDNNCQYIYFYNFENDTFTSIVIDSPPNTSKNSFAVCNGSIFLIDTENKHYINEYSKRLKLINQYYFQSEVSEVIADKNNNLFAISQTDLYKKYNNNFTCVLNFVASPVDFTNDNIMIDAQGNIYDSFEYICSSNYSGSHPSGGKIDNIFYTLANGKICGYSLSDKKIKCTYDLNASQIRTCGNKVFALCDYSLYIIPKSNFKSVKEDSKSEINSENESYFSTDYTIDNNKMRITDIPEATTASKFKKNFKLKGYSINLYKMNGEKLPNSDNVGTAMTAVLESDDERLEYELSVKGDLTGEGNCNTRDRDTIADYILRTVTFDGVYICSADMNKDGRIDTIDLVLILRVIKSKKP